MLTWGIHATYGIFGENIPHIAFYSNEHYNHLMGYKASSLVAIDNLKYPIYAYINILHDRKAHNVLLYALLDFWSIVTDFKRKKQSQSCKPVQILNSTVCYDFAKTLSNLLNLSIQALLWDAFRKGLEPPEPA